MANELLNAIWRCNRWDMKPREKLILAGFADIMRETADEGEGYADVSYDTIAAYARCSRRQAITLVHDMEKKAWTTVEHRRGRNNVNRYYLRPEKILEEPPAKPPPRRKRATTSPFSPSPTTNGKGEVLNGKGAPQASPKPVIEPVEPYNLSDAQKERVSVARSRSGCEPSKETNGQATDPFEEVSDEIRSLPEQSESLADEDEGQNPTSRPSQESATEEAPPAETRPSQAAPYTADDAWGALGLKKRAGNLAFQRYWPQMHQAERGNLSSAIQRMADMCRLSPDIHAPPEFHALAAQNSNPQPVTQESPK